MNTVSKALYAPIENMGTVTTVEKLSLRAAPTPDGRLAMNVSMVGSVFAAAENDERCRMKRRCPLVHKPIVKPVGKCILIAS